jgi:hypothetical protein
MLIPDTEITSSRDLSKSLNNYLYFKHKNHIINGKFDIWQRGTSFNVSSGAYTADRWTFVFDGSLTNTVSRQAFTLGQTDVPNEPTYFLRIAVTAASSQTFCRMIQWIESVRTVASKQITLSFYAKSDTAGDVLTTTFRQDFGTGGSPSSSVDSASKNHTLLTTFQKLTHTLTLASISGKTLGTNGNDALGLFFDFPLNQTYTIDIANIQVEQGPIASDFEDRHISEEIALCARYYQRLVNDNTLPLYAVIEKIDYSQQNPSWTIYFGYPMRVAPVATRIGTWTLGGVANAQPTFGNLTRINCNITQPLSATGAWSSSNGANTGVEFASEY